MFTQYELAVLRDAMLDYSSYWEEKKESGADVSERFMKTIVSLEEKIYKMLEEAALNHAE